MHRPPATPGPGPRPRTPLPILQAARNSQPASQNPRDRDAPYGTEDLDAVQRSFLEHSRRRRITELLAQQPGLNISQIADELDIPASGARYHLGRLEAVDLVEIRDSPRKSEVVCFLPKDIELWEEARTRVLFGGSRVSQAAILIVEQQGITADDIGEAMDLTSGGAHSHLDKLLDHGLTKRFQLDRAYRYYPTPALATWYEDVHA